MASQYQHLQHTLWHSFKQDISKKVIPEKFTYPFHYEPHALAQKAAAQLQEHIETQDWFLEGGGQLDTIDKKMLSTSYLSNLEDSCFTLTNQVI